MSKIQKLIAGHQATSPGEWRIGDAGLTVFGPKADRPSPETVANCNKKANAKFITLAHNTMPALLDGIQLAKQIAAQDPITFSDDADIPYRQLATMVNTYQDAARKLLKGLQ